MSEQASNIVPLPAEVSPASGARAPRDSEEEIERIRARQLAELCWIYDELAAGRLTAYRGQHVAVIDKKVVASDPDFRRLNKRLADELQLNPLKVATCWIECPE